jgi:hypothetical protein
MGGDPIVWIQKFCTVTSNGPAAVLISAGMEFAVSVAGGGRKSKASDRHRLPHVRTFGLAAACRAVA